MLISKEKRVISSANRRENSDCITFLHISESGGVVPSKRVWKKLNNWINMRQNKFLNYQIHGGIKGEKKGFGRFALEMVKKGLSIEFIAEVTKLDDKEILDLKSTL